VQGGKRLPLSINPRGDGTLSRGKEGGRRKLHLVLVKGSRHPTENLCVLRGRGGETYSRGKCILHLLFIKGGNKKPSSDERERECESSIRESKNQTIIMKKRGSHYLRGVLT